MEADEAPKEPSTLDRLRNMWQFANLMQYITMFGDVVKIDKDMDIQELETECLKPQPSEKLAQIGLALLKHVSSHKGLTLEIFDEYTRRQYVAKAPERNPFGTDETPNKFNDFDVFTKIRVLQQLSAWTFYNPNHIREKMALSESEQTLWRMEPLGWDCEDRTLFVLDDDRLYRLTDAPPPPPPAKSKPKSKAKKRKSRGTRSSKRRKTSTPEPESAEEEDAPAEEEERVEDDGFGGQKWECLCITLEDYENFMDGIRKTRDPNEKELYRRLENEVLPAIRLEAEEQAKKEAKKLKELEVLQKLATAKRSSRIQTKMERQKEIEEAAEAERKRKADLAMAKAEQQKQRKMEEARESRMMTREQRLKEREVKRILHEEELKRLKEDSEKLGSAEARLSERHLKAEMKRREEELQKLSEEEDWIFDCSVCGLHGENLDDGSHSIQCETCKVWQHSKCHNIAVAQAEREDFHFICKDCKRREVEAKMPKLPPLKLRLNSGSPKTPLKQSTSVNGGSINGTVQPSATPQQPLTGQNPTPSNISYNRQPTPQMQTLLNGPSLSPRGQAHGPPGIHRSEAAYGPGSSINGSSPLRPSTAGHYSTIPAVNGFPTSSPPRFQTPLVPVAPQQNHSLSFPQTNGSPFETFRPPSNPPFANFSRTGPSASPGGIFNSPVKHSPAQVPQQTNGFANAQAFPRSPSSSFPPDPSQRPSFSPTKHSSPPPFQRSSPAPPRPGTTSEEYSTDILPNPVSGLSPEKHDGLRPISSHSMSETPIFPPIRALSPHASPQIMTPPTKKMSPTPERPHFGNPSQ
jgi:hypothetical protein